MDREIVIFYFPVFAPQESHHLLPGKNLPGIPDQMDQDAEFKRRHLYSSLLPDHLVAVGIDDKLTHHIPGGRIGIVLLRLVPPE